MFNFLKDLFKTSTAHTEEQSKIKNFDMELDMELTAVVIAYEIARSDGEITKTELSILMNEIKDICKKTGKSETEIFDLIELHSKNSVSFYEYINDINNGYSKEQKLNLIKYLWDTAYADGKLDIDEERLVRRIADLINIKGIDVLKLKNISKSN